MSWTWSGSARDEAGQSWKFSLRPKIDEDAGELEGEFDWDGGNYGGREEVTGTVDSDGQFEMEGTRLHDASGIVRCRYEGRFRDHFSRIDGTWEGNCPSGSFSGR